VFAVTGLPASLHDDQDERMRRYLVSMGIRTACFILAVVAIVWLHWTAVGWVLVVAAVILPYIAVVMANASRSRRSTDLEPVPPDIPAPAQLSSPPPDEDPSPAHDEDPHR
jgi:hypothetical protein